MADKLNRTRHLSQVEHVVRIRGDLVYLLICETAEAEIPVEGHNRAATNAER